MMKAISTTRRLFGFAPLCGHGAFRGLIIGVGVGMVSRPLASVAFSRVPFLSKNKKESCQSRPHINPAILFCSANLFTKPFTKPFDYPYTEFHLYPLIKITFPFAYYLHLVMIPSSKAPAVNPAATVYQCPSQPMIMSQNPLI